MINAIKLTVLCLALELMVTLANAQLQNFEDFIPFPEPERHLIQGISFSNDGGMMYFTYNYRAFLNMQGDTTLDIPRLASFVAKKEGDGWGDASLLPFSGKYEDYEPTISPDDQYLFFNSKRPDNTEVSDKNDIWYVKRIGNGWSDPIFDSVINTSNLEDSYPTITESNRIYFVRGNPSDIRPGEFNYDLLFSDFNGSVFTEPVKVENLNTTDGESDPWVSPDESYIIFTRFKDREWSKTCDLYISFRKKGKWSDPIAMERLNTKGGPDFSPAVSSDEEWIYYRKNYQFVKAPFREIKDFYSTK